MFDLIIKCMLFSKFPSFLVIITPLLAAIPALSETNPAPQLFSVTDTRKFFPAASLLISNYITVNITKDGKVLNLLRKDEESCDETRDLIPTRAAGFCFSQIEL